MTCIAVRHHTSIAYCGAREPPIYRYSNRPSSSWSSTSETAKALGLDRAAYAARPRRRGDRMNMSGVSSSHWLVARRLMWPLAGTGAAAPSGYDAWRINAPPGGRSASAALHGGVPAGVAGIGLDHRPQSADRSSLGRRPTVSNLTQGRRGTRCACARGHPVCAGGVDRGGGAIRRAAACRS